MSTKTSLFYYRTGIQSSYQLTNDLAIGAGINLDINKLEEVDFIIPNMGNQINKASGLNCSADIGLFYKINSSHTLTAAVYTPVNATGSGSSSLNGVINHSFRLGITEAAVAYIGFKHDLSTKWSIGEKIYWSGWSIQKNLNLQNTTSGSHIIPTNWKDVWSYQMSTRYETTEKIALLGSVIYETDPNPTLTNNIGYPLASSIFISAGLDINLFNKLSTQLLYGHGLFSPKSKINTPQSQGALSANTQAAVVQFTYKT